MWFWFTNGPWFINANHEVFKFIKSFKFLVTFLLVYEFVNLEFFLGGWEGRFSQTLPPLEISRGNPPPWSAHYITTSLQLLQLLLAFICLVRSWSGNKHPKQMGEHAVVNIYLLKIPIFFSLIHNLAFPSNLDIQFFIGFTAIIAFEVYHKRSVKALAWNNYPFHAYQHLCHQSKSKPSQKSVYFICITLLKQINYPSIWWQSFSSHKSRFMYKE